VSPGCETGRVAEHVLERSQRVEVPIERAFDFYGDALNLEPMTPPWLHFQVTNEGPIVMEAGTLLDYRLRLHGVPIRWRTRIETWERPSRFTDTQLRGPYKLWDHAHSFEPDGDGATVIHDRVRYELPLGPLGALAHRLFVRRDLERIFDYREKAFAERVALWRVT
jgi:ligand-binding SRPBCC domain-containing protein